jgi:hypothetical protein
MVSMDMSITREEFLRLLPAAVGLTPFREEGRSFLGPEGSRHWRIRFTPIDDHRLGSVVLVRHRIDIDLEGYTDREAAAFLARFHRGFQRGGG